MCIPRVSSVPTRLIVANFFVHASVTSAELCLEDTVANMKGKRKKGETKSEMSHKWTQWLHKPCRVHGSPTHRLAWIASPYPELKGPHNKAWISQRGDNIKNGPQMSPVPLLSKTFFFS